MEKKKVRVFIGNLPSDISENDVKKKLKKYAAVEVVELRHKQDGSKFAFANLEDSTENIDKCFEQAFAKKWNGHQVTLQLAQESFLQRLRKERETEYCKGSKDSKPDILQKLETFNDFWRDAPSTNQSSEGHSSKWKEQESIFSTHVKRRKAPAEDGEEVSWDRCKNLEKEHEKNYGYASVKKVEDYSGRLKEKQKHVADLIKESDDKRLKSIDERYKTYMQKKEVVKYALANINDSSRPNKKIVFEDESENEGTYAFKERKRQENQSRLVLFDEDEEEEKEGEENHVEDFKIRNHFEGRKGQKLLELQARYGNDARFRLDERFVESDDAAEDEAVEMPEHVQQEEKYNMLQVLKNVLGDEAVAYGKAKAKSAINPMVRFDPSIADHSKYEIKREPKRKSKKGDLSMDLDEGRPKIKEIPQKEEKLPEVSKEKFYKVSDNLKEALQSKEKWSLMEMLGEEDKDDEQEEREFNTIEEARPIKQKVNWNLDPFKYDSSDTEDELQEEKAQAVRGRALKHETFFFLKDDHRFEEGLEFIRSYETPDPEEVHKVREKIKSIIKHKLKLKQRDASRASRRFRGRR